MLFSFCKKSTFRHFFLKTPQIVCYILFVSEFEGVVPELSYNIVSIKGFLLIYLSHGLDTNPSATETIKSYLSLTNTAE